MAGIWETPFTQQPAQAPGQSPFGQETFFQPGNTYGAAESHWTSPISQNIREQQLPLAYSSFLSRQGIPDTDSTFNRWVYSQFPRFERGYGQAIMENPFITIDDFLATLPSAQGLQQMFQQLSPQMRGLDFGQFAPVARWITR